MKRWHHRVRVTKAMREDLAAWVSFFLNHNGVTMLRKVIWIQSPQIQLFSDAAINHGSAAILGNCWIVGSWPKSWGDFDIAVLELYPITVAIEIWGHELANKCITFHCDNASVCYSINKQSSHNQTLMILIRRIVVKCLINNIMFKAQHLAGTDNQLADSLSRFQFKKARRLAPHLRSRPTKVPEQLLPGAILRQTSWVTLLRQVQRRTT